MSVDVVRTKSLFLAASEIADPTERAAYLDRKCGGDVELRARVEALFRVNEAGPQPPTEMGTATSAYSASYSALPEQTAAYTPSPGHNFQALLQQAGAIGTVIASRYTLVEVIGEGGMGSVYLAEQSEPVKRQVALKLIKSGMDSKAVLLRFEAERQALALMDHPNIARIYDGGVTPTGQPFFVMELVHGVPITRFCDERRLGIQARLELFVAVCQAVQHAHQKGIIHRDLKPSNVLVAEVDGRPTPKVIDFGVAKATEQKLTDESIADLGLIVGTPTYMSPEQADPSTLDIDTRTDVYALGVILYELLVGSPPFDAKHFKRGAILEMLRMVREDEPPRPSTKLSTADALPSIAANRAIEPAKLTQFLRGELDWVVMKAIEKDRTRRYETANAFSRDIQRYLADEVVEARPPSRGYRLRKFLRRNRGQVIAASLVLLAALGGLGAVVVVQQNANRNLADANSQISQQRDLATTAKNQAEQNERVANKQAMLALTSMQLIVTDIDGKLALQPGTANLRIGLLQILEKKWDELDLAMAGGISGEAIPTLAAVRFRIASAWASLDRLTEADIQFQKLFNQAEQRLIDKNRNHASLFNLALICRNWASVKARLAPNLEEAAALRTRAVDIMREIRSDPRPQTGAPRAHFVADVLQGTLADSASVFVREGKRTQADAAYGEAGQVCEAVLREADAKAEWFVKLKPDEQQLAIRGFGQSLEITRAGRANNLCALGKIDAAIAIYNGIVERSRAAQAKATEDPIARTQLAVQLGNYGLHMLRVGRTEEAAQLLAESLELYEKNFNADPTDARLKRSFAYGLYYMGVARDAQGRAADARALFERSRALRAEMHAVSADKANKLILMLSEARLGNVDATKALADQLSAFKGKDPELRLDVARSLALLVPKTQGAVQESLRNAAMAALERCLDDGQRDLFTIASQLDLAPIKDDARFRAILARLTNPNGSKQEP